MLAGFVNFDYIQVVLVVSVRYLIDGFAVLSIALLTKQKNKTSIQKSNLLKVELLLLG